jgi:hypothetical protein
MNRETWLVLLALIISIIGFTISVNNLAGSGGLKKVVNTTLGGESK